VLAIIEAAGWPIWPLILASIIAVAIIIERAYSLRIEEVAPAICWWRRSRPIRIAASPGSRHQTLRRFAVGTDFCDRTEERRNSREVMKESIEESGRAVTHELDRFLTSLGTIASMAPLLGCLAPSSA